MYSSGNIENEKAEVKEEGDGDNVPWKEIVIDVVGVIGATFTMVYVIKFVSFLSIFCNNFRHLQ